LAARTCKRCFTYKDISHFQPYGYQCRACRTEKQREYVKSLPPKNAKQILAANEAQKRWRENNPERAKEHSRKTHLKIRFGMTVEQYDEMLKNQNGVCAICYNKCATGNNLAIDHNHDTQEIRALLCKNCNTAIGLLKENIETIENMKKYLIKFNSVGVR
jgi:hypothetical protein